MNLFKLITTARLLLAFSSNAQTIKLSLAKDQKYEVITISKVNSVASVMGQEMENNTDVSIVEKFEVTDTRPNETDIISTIIKMKLAVQAMGQETNYDSDKKDNSGPGAEEMSKQIGKVKTMTINGNGKIIKQSKDDGDITAGAMGGFAIETLPLLLHVFIGKEIKEGASWYDSTTTLPDKITTNIAGNYTIKTIDPFNLVTVEFKGTRTTSGTMEQMGQEMAMTSTGKVTSEYVLDINTGLITKSSSSTDGSMTIEGAGMSIPVTTKNTIITTLKLL